MKPNRWSWVLGLCLTGCASKVAIYEGDKQPEFLTTRETALFRHGPSQPGRPDQLPAETFLRLQSHEASYCVVTLPDGRSGYVATEDLRPAPAVGRAVTNADLFPEEYASAVEVNLPEPDFSMPIEEVPKSERR